jgi:hypothetical protein
MCNTECQLKWFIAFADMKSPVITQHTLKKYQLGAREYDEIAQQLMVSKSISCISKRDLRFGAPSC